MQSTTPATEGRPVARGVAIAITSGVAAALQTRLHGQLGSDLHDGTLTAIISFGLGLLILLTMFMFSQNMRRGVAKIGQSVKAGQLPWWLLFGGFAGALTVFSQAMTAAAIGVALFTVAMVAGQTISSLVIDRIGLGPAGVIKPTATRLLAAGVAVVAVIVGVWSELSSGGSWLLLLPVAAGFGIGYQQAANGRVRVAAGNAGAATLLNFVIGFTALCVAWLVTKLTGGFTPYVFPSEWWLYIGGALGVFQVLIMAIVVQWTGVLLLGLSLIFGQLAAALVLDAFAPDIVLTGNVYVGVVLALLAVLLASGLFRRRQTVQTA